MNYDHCDPTAAENRAPKFCVGDLAQNDSGYQYEVLAVDGPEVWCKSTKFGTRCTWAADELTLVLDTVLVEMPRDLRDRISIGDLGAVLGDHNNLIAACRKSKEQDQ